MLSMYTALKRFNELTVSCEDIVFISFEMASTDIMTQLMALICVCASLSVSFYEFCQKQAPPPTDLVGTD